MKIGGREEIPEFPEFTGITLAIQDELEEYVNRYPCYSDFNFASLYSWNIDEDMGVSWHNGNAVFLFSDYMTGLPFYSFIGEYQVDNTARDLLKAAKVQKYISELKLIPKVIADQLTVCSDLHIVEDRDNHDYMLSVAELCNLKGRKHAHTRELVNRFRRDWGNRSEFKQLDPASEKIQQRMLEIFHYREQAKTDNDETNELEAIKRILNSSEVFNLACFGVEIDQELQSFIICETLSSGDVMAHFWKANTDHRGIYQYMLHKVSGVLHTEGFSRINFEQDLGIHGLRASKLYLRPTQYLKKYTVTENGHMSVAALPNR